jgi:predicted HTH transcriptional regulator
MNKFFFRHFHFSWIVELNIIKAGSGGPRIIDAATKNSLKAPDIDTYFDATTIKIWKN